MQFTDRSRPGSGRFVPDRFGSLDAIVTGGALVGLVAGVRRGLG